MPVAIASEQVLIGTSSPLGSCSEGGSHEHRVDGWSGPDRPTSASEDPPERGRLERPQPEGARVSGAEVGRDEIGRADHHEVLDDRADDDEAALVEIGAREAKGIATMPEATITPTIPTPNPMNPFEAVSAPGHLVPAGSAGQGCGAPGLEGLRQVVGARLSWRTAPGGARRALSSVKTRSTPSISAGRARAVHQHRAHPGRLRAGHVRLGRVAHHERLRRPDIVAAAAPPPRCAGVRLRAADLGGHHDLVHEPAQPDLGKHPAQRHVPVRDDRGAGSRQPQPASAGAASGYGRNRSDASSTSTRSSSASAAACGSCSRSTAAQRLRRSASDGGIRPLVVVSPVVRHLGQHRPLRILLGTSMPCADRSVSRSSGHGGSSSTSVPSASNSTAS